MGADGDVGVPQLRILIAMGALLVFVTYPLTLKRKSQPGAANRG